MNVPCNNANRSVCTSDTMNELNVSTNIVDADVLLNDVIDNSESVDCNHDDEVTMWVMPIKMLRGLATQMSTI